MIVLQMAAATSASSKAATKILLRVRQRLQRGIASDFQTFHGLETNSASFSRTGFPQDVQTLEVVASSFIKASLLRT